MGIRYIMDVTCPKCGVIATDCYYAPTCDFVTHVCESCGAVIDLGEYTSISYEDASNVEEIKIVMAKCETDMKAMGATVPSVSELEELQAAIVAYREMVSRARGAHEESATLIGWILEPVDIFESQARLRTMLEASVVYTPREPSPSEALYGFVGWLTTRDERVVMSSRDDAAVVADLVAGFCRANQFADPRKGWSDNLVHPGKDEMDNPLLMIVRHNPDSNTWAIDEDSRHHLEIAANSGLFELEVTAIKQLDPGGIK